MNVAVNSNASWALSNLYPPDSDNDDDDDTKSRASNRSKSTPGKAKIKRAGEPPSPSGSTG